MIMSAPIKTYSIEGVKGIIEEAGLPLFRADQVLSWIYGKGVESYEEMTNLPKSMREQLEDSFPLYHPELVVKNESVDGSRKYLLKYHDDVMVETVGLPSRDGRLTVCCSSQAGCGMGCSFCATGKQGLVRNLCPGEIVDQVIAVQNDFNVRVTNIVVMGQGEPFANYDDTLAALRILNNPRLLNIGSRHITISTCGIIAGIERFSKEKEQFTLAVSLHSAIQEKRDALMPGMKNQSLASLHESLERYNKSDNRRFTFEYALMKNVNDGTEDLDALISYCKGLLCHVNLIPLNDVEDSLYKPVSYKAMEEWKNKLEKKGIASTVRNSKGGDVSAACGQLKASYVNAHL